ncbi:MAG: metallophosphoesterase, partial [bacterium]|nr:metallophosphoesterase [bacterium]
RVRLWQDRAEFDAAGQGVCGLRKVERGGGFAHVDVYFEDQTGQELRERFISFVEEHLRQHGVEIVEHVEITCACGFRFPGESIRRRIVQGDEDIGCPECDRRTRITEGAKTARERDPDVARDTWALRTAIEERKKQIVASVKQVFGTPDEEMLTGESIRILHLSDLHFGPDVDWRARLLPLVADVRDEAGGLGFQRLDYLVISGDLTNRAAPEEFEAAFEFVSGLISRFELTAERCIIVPGNHDLSWDEDVYEWKPERKAGIDKLPDGYYCPQGSGYLVRDEERYPNRFKNFSRYFYHPLVQKEYPLDLAEQGLSFFFDENEMGIQFITLNSAWQIDEWFRERSGIHPGALERGLERANDDVRRAKSAGRFAEDASILRIAVWHHPLMGNEKIQDDAFVGRLMQEDVRICLHGHVHEERADLACYLDPRRIHVVGAGSFDASLTHRPESTPRLYNLLEIPRDRASIKVHTRHKRRGSGAWQGWGIWPSDNPGERRTHYTIKLEER